MKLSVIYDTKTGNTGKMAEAIAEGIRSVEGAEARAFPIGEVDLAYAKESCALIVGTPTYNGSLTARMKEWLETGLAKLEPAGKMGGAFATAAYVHGGGDLAIQCVLTHLLVDGMLVYSSGASQGAPVIHLGPVAISTELEQYTELFRLYGRRMAEQAARLF